MANMEDFFKKGDKFDFSRNAIVRNELVDGVFQTTYISLRPDLLGWTIIPGVGLQTPLPNRFLLLTDGDIVDLENKIIVDASGARKDLTVDENGNYIIESDLGNNLIVSENSDGIATFAQKDEASDAPPKEIEQQLITEEYADKFEQIMPYIIENTSKPKAKAFDLMSGTASYQIETQIPKPGTKNGKTKVNSQVTVTNDNSNLFTLSNGTRMVEEGGVYYLEFAPNKNVLEYLESRTDDKLKSVTKAADGKYRFPVDKCYLSTANGFHVTALGGLVRFDSNAVASVLSFDGRAFTEQTVEDKKGMDITMSAKFLELAYSGKNDIFKSGVFKTQEGKDLSEDALAEKMPIDNFIALANLQPAKNGVKRYGKGDLQVFMCDLGGIEGDPQYGDKTTLMVVKIGQKDYIYHDNKLVALNDEKQCRCVRDSSGNIAITFDAAKKLKGSTSNQLVAAGSVSGEHTEQNIVELFEFLSGKKAGPVATAPDGTKVPDYEDVADLKARVSVAQAIKSAEKTPIRVNTNIVEPEVKEKEAEKTDEDTNEPPPPSGDSGDSKDNTDEKVETSKHDPKKGNAFWNTLSNGFFFAMLFAGIASMFGLGVVAMPLMIGFAAAGAVCKGIAYQGGFGLTRDKIEKIEQAAEDLNDKDKSKGKTKEKSKEKDTTKKLSRRQRKYLERLQKLQEHKDQHAEVQHDIDDLRSRLDLARDKHMDHSDEAIEMQVKVEKLRTKRFGFAKKAAKLENENRKYLRDCPTTELLDFMGPRPPFEDIEFDTLRENFDDPTLQSAMIHHLMGDELVAVRERRDIPTVQGEILAPDQGYNFSAENSHFLAELMPGERAILFGTMEDLDEMYGENKDSYFMDAFIRFDRITYKQEQGMEPTPAEKKYYAEFKRTLAQARADLGENGFNEWASHIRSESVERHEYIQREFGISSMDTLLSLQKDDKIARVLRRKADKLESGATLPENEMRALEESEARVAAVREAIGEHCLAQEREEALRQASTPELRAQVEATYADPEYCETIKARYAKERYGALVESLSTANQNTMTINPVSQRVRVMARYESALDRSTYTELEYSMVEKATYKSFEEYAEHEVRAAQAIRDGVYYDKDAEAAERERLEREEAERKDYIARSEDVLDDILSNGHLLDRVLHSSVNNAMNPTEKEPLPKFVLSDEQRTQIDNRPWTAEQLEELRRAELSRTLFGRLKLALEDRRRAREERERQRAAEEARLEEETKRQILEAGEIAKGTTLENVIHKNARDAMLGDEVSYEGIRLPEDMEKDLEERKKWVNSKEGKKAIKDEIKKQKQQEKDKKKAARIVAKEINASIKKMAREERKEKMEKYKRAAVERAIIIDTGAKKLFGQAASFISRKTREAGEFIKDTAEGVSIFAGDVKLHLDKWLTKQKFKVDPDKFMEMLQVHERLTPIPKDQRTKEQGKELGEANDYINQAKSMMGGKAYEKLEAKAIKKYLDAKKRELGSEYVKIHHKKLSQEAVKEFLTEMSKQIDDASKQGFTADRHAQFGEKLDEFEDRQTSLDERREALAAKKDARKKKKAEASRDEDNEVEITDVYGDDESPENTTDDDREYEGLSQEEIAKEQAKKKKRPTKTTDDGRSIK